MTERIERILSYSFKKKEKNIREYKRALKE
jgi:hypothetical protein